MIETLNLAFIRSNISHRARIEVDYINWVYQIVDICEDSKELALNSEAKSLRILHSADIVVMLTDHNYPASSDYGCVASVGPNKDKAYSIVDIKYANTAHKVFVHEMGHLFGAKHQRDSKPSNEKYECNFAHEVVSNRYYTLMHTHAPSPPTQSAGRHFKILNFSDPEVLFRGNQTGSYGMGSPLEGVTNNAGRIRETGCEIADFFGESELVVMLSGNNKLCSIPEIYKATVISPPIGNPGQPPYTYQWHWNWDGLFSSQNPGTLLAGSTDQLSIPPPNLTGCKYFFIEIKVTSSDGTTGTAIKRIATSCAACQPIPSN